MPEGPLVGKVVKVKKDFAHRLLISVFFHPSSDKKKPTNYEESGKPTNYEDFVVSGLWAAGPPKPKNCQEFDTEKVNPSNAGFL